MDRSEVERIFREKKDLLLNSQNSVQSPIAYILGGSPASGKSNLEEHFSVKSCDILHINGDEYRIFHPNYSSLVFQANRFPTETQIFSNVFTEGLIGESIERRLNVSVEGTMRRSDIVLKTASMFREAGFRTEALCIVAPAEYSHVNTYHRYVQDLERSGTGRLASIEAINETVTGVPNTLDELHRHKAVDTIRIFDIYAQRELKTYHLVNGKWDDILTPPSVVANVAIHNQKNNPALLSMHQERAKQTLRMLEKNAPNLIPEFSRVIKALEIIAQSIKNKLISENIL